MIGSRARRRRRHGSAYVLVLAVSMILTVVGFSAITLARLEARSITAANDASVAHNLARSGMEHAMLTVFDAIAAAEAANADWRLGFTHGAPSPAVAFAGGTYSWALLDATGDGDLDDDATDPVDVVVTGAFGGSTHRLSLRLALGGGGAPLTCLETALHAGGSITISSGSIDCDQIVSSNDQVNAVDSTVNADVEAVNSILGATYNGTTTGGVASRELPGASVFSYYVANGTAISITDLPLAAGKRQVKSVLLSPFSNPFPPGTPDPLGIYVIDCAGADIKISYVRIVGTLVLIDPGPGSTIVDAMNWEPAVAHYPALLVDGDMELDLWSQWPLEESWAGSAATQRNFNPAGTPYQGVTDADMADEFPSVLAGLVYVSGDLTIVGKDATFEGVVVAGGTLSSTSPQGPVVSYRDRFLTTPPPGFTSASGGSMQIVGGGWARVVE